MDFKLIKILFFMCTFFFIKINSHANVIYDKNNIIISELDIVYYKEFYFKKYNEEILDSKALKNLVMIKNLIISLEYNNPDFIKNIDLEISKEIGNKNINSKTVIDIIRYFKTKNVFVTNYFNNEFKRDELGEIFSNFNTMELPISNNNCLTMNRLINFKNNKEFYDIFFKNLKNDKKVYEVTIDNKKVNICMNQKNNQIIQGEIFKYIELKIQKEFDEFVYAQQRN